MSSRPKRATTVSIAHAQSTFRATSALTAIPSPPPSLIASTVPEAASASMSKTATEQRSAASSRLMAAPTSEASQCTVALPPPVTTATGPAKRVA